MEMIQIDKEKEFHDREMENKIQVSISNSKDKFEWLRDNTCAKKVSIINFMLSE